LAFSQRNTTACLDRRRCETELKHAKLRSVGARRRHYLHPAAAAAADAAAAAVGRIPDN